MIQFLVENPLTRAVTDSDGDALIDSVLRYKVPSYEIVKRRMGYKAMLWDGTKSLYSKGIFLTGLLDKVLVACRETGTVFKIEDRRPAVEARRHVDYGILKPLFKLLRSTNPAYPHDSPSKMSTCWHVGHVFVSEINL
jgi:hypothetical protein